MSFKLLILTLMTVSARNIHKENVRDISLPEPKLDFSTSYESSGLLSEYHNNSNKESGDFDEHRRANTDSSPNTTHKSSNERSNNRKHHQNEDFGHSRSDEEYSDRRWPNKQYNPELSSENEQKYNGSPEVTGLRDLDVQSQNNDHHRHHRPSKHNVRNDGSVSSNLDDNFQGRSSLNQHRTINSDISNVGHRIEDSQRGFQGYNNHDQFSTGREQQNIKELHQQINQNERYLDDISSANRDYFQSGRKVGQNSREHSNIQEHSRKITHQDKGHYDVIINRENVGNRRPIFAQYQNISNEENKYDSLNPQTEANVQLYRVNNSFDKQSGHDKHHQQRQNVDPTFKKEEVLVTTPNFHNTEHKKIPTVNQRTKNAASTSVRHIPEHKQPNLEKRFREDIEPGKNHSDSNGRVNISTLDFSNQTNEPRLDQTRTRHKQTGKNNDVDTVNVNNGTVDDKWVWATTPASVINKNTTDLSFDDRAAFTGDKCPTGQVKVNNVCVDVD